MFNGSFAPTDVAFLLDIIPASTTGGTPLADKVAGEFRPDAQYYRFFWDAVRASGKKLAADVALVASQMHATTRMPITLVTLVRAGTPTGVLVRRALSHLGHDCTHYSIASVRGRGIDETALDYITARHPQESIIFLDGWTGKGFIATELEDSIARYNVSRGKQLKPSLAVLADLAGVAGLAASEDDYLIPFSMLLGTICGLIGGSFPKEDTAKFDKALYFDTLAESDQTLLFIEYMDQLVREALSQVPSSFRWDEQRRAAVRRVSAGFVTECMTRFGLDGSESVKPGVCEANRALITRNGKMLLLLRDPQADQLDQRNLRLLAEAKNVPVLVWPDMPYSAGVVLDPTRLVA